MEPVTLTLAGVGGVALTEGVKFLYAEAGDLLKRWLDRKNKPEADDDVRVDIRLPEVFEGQLRPATLEPNIFAQNESALTDAYQRVSLYAGGVKPIEPTDHDLLESASQLRAVLERILGQTLTLKGEERPASGAPVVRGSFGAQTVRGEGAGVRATIARSGLIEGAAQVKTVTEQGKVYGVHIDEIGS